MLASPVTRCDDPRRLTPTLLTLNYKRVGIKDNMKQIELLLTENVDNLGIVGDVVKVRPGYARNFLLPRGMATTPTPGNVKRLAARRAEVEKEMKARRAALEATLEKLKGHEITIQRSANEQGVLFGGVSQHEIAEALRSEGHQIEDRMVRIGETIKRLDSYHIPIVLANDLKCEIKLWVVSDKPSDQLGDQDRKDEDAGASAGTAESSAEKTVRKSRKHREEEAGEVKETRGKGSKAEESKDAGDSDAKPRKKGKKVDAE